MDLPAGREANVPAASTCAGAVPVDRKGKDQADLPGGNACSFQTCGYEMRC